MTARVDSEQVRADFQAAVNMTAAEIEAWLKTPESQRVGWKGRNGSASESVGHASGRRIVQILRKTANEFAADDYLHMRKVVGFVRRHTAQRPDNIYTSSWPYSLMNWGHDPTKEDAG